MRSAQADGVGEQDVQHAGQDGNDAVLGTDLSSGELQHVLVLHRQGQGDYFVVTARSDAGEQFVVGDTLGFRLNDVPVTVVGRAVKDGNVVPLGTLASPSEQFAKANGLANDALAMSEY